MSQTLTQQIDALSETHRLSSLSIVRITVEGRPAFWSVTAQGDAKIGAADYGTADLSAAIAEAITALNVARNPAVVVPELECAA